MEAREHTAQVPAEAREDREQRFRKGLGPEGLPVLFCSPTMELGVDIARLNAVYMRNVPPTPANYAQRSGRAGRSGQPALVVTYCAARAPHDQHFFSDPTPMVAGAAEPPNIDLANEDLIRSHLHAVWLAETGVCLGTAIPDALDREQPDGLPLKAEAARQIGDAGAAENANRRARRILATLAADLSPADAPWYTAGWLDAVTGAAARRLDKAFDRWRSLYRATASQMQSANDALQNAAATEGERKNATARFTEAARQQGLLLDKRATIYSDFHTYRYLAAEGFLPGYNFPRLPLMAFIPGRRAGRKSFLSRPRFLGLTEFGPRSIIYHEGSTYRVRRAILAARDENTGRLEVQCVRICPECGYGHFADQADFERCANCNARLEGGRRIANLHQIEQVSTQLAQRITSDEEERRRQGYETITTLRYSVENGTARAERAAAAADGEVLLTLRYGPAATIWRINLGWRRRPEPSIYGFSVDPHTGEWAQDAQAPTDAEDDAVREGASVQRVAPFVADTRNVLVVRPAGEMSERAMVSLQYALKRGVERAFQLEEAELAAEPLPDRAARRAILFYEAAEGGAGVLARLVRDPGALGRAAREALAVCHYQPPAGAHFGADDLIDLEKEECEAGCYRCLLSYHNQPDHPQIDRRDPEMLDLLCRLTRGTLQASADSPPGGGDIFPRLWNAAGSDLERAWLTYIKEHGYRLPDKAQHYLAAYATRPDFAYTQSAAVVYIDGPHHERPGQRRDDAAITERLADAGFTVVRFGAAQAAWAGVVAEFGWIFGPGSAKGGCDGPGG